MSYIYNIPTGDGTATHLQGHRGFGAFGTRETVTSPTRLIDADGNDVFNGPGVRLGNLDEATCSTSYMAITLIPKWSGANSNVFKMKVVE